MQGSEGKEWKCEMKKKKNGARNDSTELEASLDHSEDRVLVKVNRMTNDSCDGQAQASVHYTSFYTECVLAKSYSTDGILVFLIFEKKVNSYSLN